MSREGTIFNFGNMLIKKEEQKRRKGLLTVKETKKTKKNPPMEKTY